MTEEPKHISTIPSLTAQGLSCERGEQRLFEGVSFTLAPGECLRVTGSNGAGKSSFMRMLCGLLPQTEGSVTWAGFAIDRCRIAFQKAAYYLGHDTALAPSLTPWQILTTAVALRGEKASPEDLKATLSKVGLEGYAHEACHHLSQGQKRRLTLAACLLSGATLWLLDEPFTALDAEGVALAGALCNEHLSRGGLLVLVSHLDVNLSGAKRIHDLRLGHGC